MKEEREWNRRSHALEKHGVKIIREPQKNLILCNAGLSTGLTEKDLFETFAQYGAIERYLMLPGKSYSFLVYADVESAIAAHKSVHGTKRLCQNGHSLYLAFVSSVENDESEKNIIKPDGLILLENFIDSEEERILMDQIVFDDSATGSELKHRRVKHYGYEFLYGSNNIDAANPLKNGIPSSCNFLWERFKQHGLNYPFPPNQLTINQYNPGQGIPSHVDTHSAFYSPLISLSLENPIMMDFKKLSSDGQYQHYHVVLPPKSILIMDGSSRYEWSHGIVPRTYDIIDGKYHERLRRTSFTFRWIRPDGKCDCSFPQQCDVVLNQKNDFGKYASAVEQNHVHKVYEEIASHFSETRVKIWPSVSNFIESLDIGTILVDIGCGNGKNLQIRQDIISIGLEYSHGLAELAARNNSSDGHEYLKDIMRGNCLHLPFPTESVDAAISIAVFHHLATKERRIKAIGEIVRVLRVGGRALISVWAKNQIRDDVKTSYLKQDRKNRKQHCSAKTAETITEVLKDKDGQSLDVELPVHKNRTDFSHQDMLVPWKTIANNTNIESKQNQDTFMRFYHVFEEGELEELCKSFISVNIESSFYEQGNWCIVLKKINNSS